MNKIAIYTAIFGTHDRLLKPDYLPANCDFICFTDQNFQVKPWQIRKVEIEKSARRTARKYKILPHKFLFDYQISVWIDGNMIVSGDVPEAVGQYLQNKHMAVYDHNFTQGDARACVYEEARLMKSSKKKGQEDLIKKQMEKYRSENYPVDNGLISSMIIFRRHNRPEVIKTMEKWWEELANYSNRDQLSFNYAAWKTGLDFIYLKEDSRDNKYFYQVRHNLTWRQRFQNYLRLLKKMF